LSEEERDDRIHLGAHDLAAYLDRRLDASDQERVEAHLARCSGCRLELAAVSALLEARPPFWRRRSVLGPAVAAAAAIALFFVWPEAESDLPAGPLHRETPGVTEERPNPLSPAGTVPVVEGLEWSTASGADRYRVTLFDESGTVVWKAETTTTAASLPDSVVLEPGRLYLWQVEARVGVDRWVASELTRFTVGLPPAAPGSEVRRP
jgi:hypothetical protein